MKLDRRYVWVYLPPLFRSSFNYKVNVIEGDIDLVQLEVISKDKSFESNNGLYDRPCEILEEDIDAFYLSTTNSFGFTGNTIGMNASKKLF